MSLRVTLMETSPSWIEVSVKRSPIRSVVRGVAGGTNYGSYEFERSGLMGAAFARMTGLQYQTFASWIQRRRHERGDYQMAAPALKASRRPVPGVRLMEVVKAGPGHPEGGGRLALSVELRCGGACCRWCAVGSVARMEGRWRLILTPSRQLGCCGCHLRVAQ
jgi:hypothetical protein